MTAEGEPRRNNLEQDDSKFTGKFVKAFSPRSKEACRLLGVLPKECAVRSFESFAQQGLAPEIQKLRYQEFESLRQETIQMVREQRYDLVQKGWQPTSTKYPLIKGQGDSKSKKAAVAAADRARIEKLMARQNKELEAMVSYEVKMANLRARQDAKLENRKLSEKKAKEERKQEMLRAAEKKRQWELAKAKEEEEIKAKNAAEAKKLYIKEQKYLAELARKEEERKQEARRKQEERVAKRREHEKRTAALQTEQFMAMQMKQEEMDRREQKLAADFEAKKKFMEEVSAEKAKQATMRIAIVLDDKERILEEKRNEVEERMRAQQKRLKEFEVEQERKLMEKRRKANIAQGQRLAAMEAQKKRDEQRVKMLVQEQYQKDLLVEELEMKKRRERDFKAELIRLNEARKYANNERLKRQENYRRAQLIEKVNMDAKKVREIDLVKQKTLKERQLYQIGLVRQKRQLVELFGKIKQSKNWKTMGKLDLTAELSKSSSSARLPLTDASGDQRRGSEPGKKSMKYSHSTPTLAH